MLKAAGDIIIFVGAIFLAVSNITGIISKIIKKPVDRFKDTINQEINNEVPKIIDNSLKEIKDLNITQNKNIELLLRSSKDILRQRIMEIYHKWKDKRMLPISEKEFLDELYKDYKAEGGNSFIDKYYGRMSTWKILDDGYSEPDK